MNLIEWRELSIEEQNRLAMKYGITRSGENNQVVKEEELLKIPVEKTEKKPKEDVKKVSTKKSSKPIVKKTPKLGNGRGVATKSKSRKSK